MKFTASFTAVAEVFMRGVCALNFEAMSLLNDPQGGGPVPWSLGVGSKGIAMVML